MVESNGASKLSELESNIIRQLEYYFGDSNLNRDKFLQEQISKDDGWVPVKTLLTFKRLQALSEDEKVIVDAIEKSDEGLVQVSEDRTKLRRHPERPLPEQNEEHRKEVMSRTCYVKGFPLDADMNTLIEFFRGFDKVVNIVMRKYHDKGTKEYKFKGSVFATFATKDQAEAFLKLEGVKHNEVALIRKWQDTYNEEKREERNANKKKKDAAKEEEEKEKIELPKGATINLDGFDPEATREKIRESLQEALGTTQIAFIEFEKGQTSGHVRFQEADSAKGVLERCKDGKITVNDKEITVRVLEGEEEEEYLKEQINNIRERRQAFNSRHKGRRGGNRGNDKFNKGGKKRKADDALDGDDGDKVSKKQEVDA
ncbi:la protein homolog [Culicoides brevitarsis]|uniref:la protein homolog n=1 Tax=Culicoides brevitarsis TaxID=469753 RepID=UPI00307BEC43